MIENCDCALCMFIKGGGQIPGKGARRKRFNAWLQEGGKCFYCAEILPTWESGVLEHIIPKSKGGTKTVLACTACDAIKKNYHTAAEFDEAITRLTTIKDKVLAYAEKGGNDT